MMKLVVFSALIAVSLAYGNSYGGEEEAPVAEPEPQPEQQEAPAAESKDAYKGLGPDAALWNSLMTNHGIYSPLVNSYAANAIPAGLGQGSYAGAYPYSQGYGIYGAAPVAAGYGAPFAAGYGAPSYAAGYGASPYAALGLGYPGSLSGYGMSGYGMSGYGAPAYGNYGFTAPVASYANPAAGYGFGGLNGWFKKAQKAMKAQKQQKKKSQ